MKFIKTYESFSDLNDKVFLLSEMSQKDAVIATLAEIGADTVEDISFKFKSRKQPTKKGVLSHDIITIEAWNVPDGYKENVQFLPYHLIFGENSMAIFDALGVNEVAGLTRVDCQAHLDKLKDEGKTETYNGAFIAGLCNWSGEQIFQFINVGRASLPGYSNRIIPHESLHMARMLITIEANEFIRTNQGKGEWWVDDRATFTKLEDESEEYFAETLERVSAIAYDRYDKIKGQFKVPVKPTGTEVKPLAPDEYKKNNA